MTGRPWGPPGLIAFVLAILFAIFACVPEASAQRARRLEVSAVNAGGATVVKQRERSGLFGLRQRDTTVITAGGGASALQIRDGRRASSVIVNGGGSAAFTRRQFITRRTHVSQLNLSSYGGASAIRFVRGGNVYQAQQLVSLPVSSYYTQASTQYYTQPNTQYYTQPARVVERYVERAPERVIEREEAPPPMPRADVLPERVIERVQVPQYQTTPCPVYAPQLVMQYQSAYYTAPQTVLYSRANYAYASSALFVRSRGVRLNVRGY